MAAPTLVASYFVQQNINATTPLTTPSFTPSNGEVIVVKLGTWDSATSMGAPTGGSQTYTSRVIVAPGGFRPWTGIYTAVISGSPGAMTISSTPSASARYSMVVERWSGAQLAASPVTNSANNATGAASSTLTTSAANSIISWAAGDAQSLDPATRAYLNSATDEGVRDGHSGANGVEYYAYQVVATAGSTSYGLSAPTGMQWNIAGIEVLAASGATTVNGTATLTSQSTLASGALVTTIATSTLTSQSTLTSAGKVTTFGVGTLTSQSTLTVSGFPSKLGVAALSSQSSLTAAGTVTGTGVSANLSSQSSLTVAGLVTELPSSVLSSQSTLTATGLVTRQGAAVLTSQSVLTTNSLVATTGTAALSGQSTLTATGFIGSPPNTAILSAQSILTVAGIVGRVGNAALVSDSTLVVNGKANSFAASVLSGQSTLTVAGTIGKFGASALSAQSTLIATGFIPVVFTGSANLSATSTLIANAQANPPWVLKLIEFASVDISNTMEVSGDTVISYEGTDTVTVGIEGG